MNFIKLLLAKQILDIVSSTIIIIGFLYFCYKINKDEK